jgi:phosphatidylglycerophosphatase A
MKRQTSVHSMKEQKIQGPRLPHMLFLSWFYTGKSPKAPGTVGSLATLPLIYLLHYFSVNIYGLLGIIVALYVAAVVVAQNVQLEFGLKDPQWIVIDEVIGMLITWSFVRTVDFPTIFLVFSLFRLFDIIKIWPASYFDKIPHGFGTITDDVVSGVFAGILTKLVVTFF